MSIYVARRGKGVKEVEQKEEDEEKEREVEVIGSGQAGKKWHYNDTSADDVTWIDKIGPLKRTITGTELNPLVPMH